MIRLALSARRSLRTAAGAVLALAMAAPALAHTPMGEVALTFDDLPGMSIYENQSYIEASNAKLLAGLLRHRVPATGFVNEGKFDEFDRARQIAIVRRWIAAGLDAGNHTYDHVSPNEVGADGYIADIAKGEPITKALLAEHGKTMRWFRHPYLETGYPAPVRAKIEAWLAAHGYRVAPVTMDADDWEFAEPYDDALAHHDAHRARALRAAYLAYTAQTVAWYQSAAQAVFGHQIAFVMLLHDTRLNADSLPQLLRVLHHARLRPVSLDTAMADPAYRTPDHTDTKDGIDWLERWSDTLHKPLPWDRYHDVPKAIEDAYNKVDPGGR